MEVAALSSLAKGAGPSLESGMKTSTGSVSQGSSFQETLQAFSDDTVTKMASAEAMAIKGINGQAGAYEVASAVMQAEQSLKLAVSVRDKIVSAYLDVSRMQI